MIFSNEKMARTEVLSMSGGLGGIASSSSADHTKLQLMQHHCCRISFRLSRPDNKQLVTKSSSPCPIITCIKDADDHHLDFLQASLLLPETAKHYHLRKHGFPQVTSPVNSIGFGLSILRRFHHPTIFLKISCHGDFLLPILVGESSVETLIHSLFDDRPGDYPTQFDFARNLVLQLGYEVKMVKITKRVVSTYFARIYFGKAGETESFSIDARPSDAINVAKRCEAPIYVNKEVVAADAIRIAYGTGRILETKPIYDVLLDSPAEGQDLVMEELKMVWNLKLAVEEERYRDAAKWRDKLGKLRDQAT